MSTRETGVEFEQLRTEVEELNNALSRIVDILKDQSLNESERIDRAVLPRRLSSEGLTARTSLFQMFPVTLQLLGCSPMPELPAKGSPAGV